MALKAALSRKGGLTLSQLASYDDLITDALIDQVYFWTTVRKNRARYAASRGLREEEIAGILRQCVVIGKDIQGAISQLLQTPGLRRYYERLKSADEKEHFQRHLRKYVLIYMPDSAFEVTTTNRYTITTPEAAVVARKYVRKGEAIKYLTGIQVAMTREEEMNLDVTRRDFSIVMSSRKKTPSLFLGPARFANHDCDANARLMTAGPNGMQVVATKDIEIGQEITVTYGDDYFGEDNCECLCASCERLERNGWAQSGTAAAMPPSSAADQEQQGGPYSFRNKRKYVQESNDVSRSMTPERVLERPQKRRKTSDQVVSDTSQQPAKRKRGRPRKNPLPEEATPVLCSTSLTVSTEINPNSSLAVLQSLRRQRNNALPSSSSESFGRSASPPLSTRDGSRRTQSTDATSVEIDDGAGKAMDKIEATVLETTVESEVIVPEVTITAVPDLDDAELSSELSDISGSLELDEDILNFLKQHDPPSKRRRVRAGRQSFVAPLDSYPEQRRPGDWTMTPLLLAAKYSRWLSCQNCDTAFVQSDAYQIRSSCPRCERHSKLYGYAWPKTDKEGKQDTEERVLDHRTIHRFVKPEMQRILNRRRTFPSTLSERDEAKSATPVNEAIQSDPLFQQQPKKRRGRPPNKLVRRNSIIEQPPKRRRGRASKEPVQSKSFTEQPPKRKRGRPRKIRPTI